MSDIEVTMDCDKCKVYQYDQGRKETKKEILAFCKEAYHLKEVIEFLEQDLGAE